MIDLGGSALTGGIFGVLGTALGRVLGLVERRDAHAQERARWAHEITLHRLNRDMRAAETEQELAVLSAQMSGAGLTESLRAEASLPGGYPWVDAVRALVRPVLTPLLWGVYLILVAMVLSAEPDLSTPLLSRLLEDVAFAASAATLWWFGDRAPRRQWVD